jgi:hypothetical protein
VESSVELASLKEIQSLHGIDPTGPVDRTATQRNATQRNAPNRSQLKLIVRAVFGVGVYFMSTFNLCVILAHK